MQPWVKHAFARVTPAISSFSAFFIGSEQERPCLLVRTQIPHFRRFRQNSLFLAGDKGTVYQKHRFLDPETSRDAKSQTITGIALPNCL